MIQYQILQPNIIRIIWQIVRRITDEILGMKELMRISKETVIFNQTCDKCSISQPSNLVSKFTVKTDKADKYDGRYVVGSSNDSKIFAVELKPFL